MTRFDSETIKPSTQYFLVHQHHTWKLNETYRVSLLGNELVFLYVGKAVSEESARGASKYGAVGVHHGAVGGLAGGLIAAGASHMLSKQLEEVTRNLQKAEHADEATLRELVKSEGGFLIKATDMQDVSITPPWWGAIMGANATPYHATLTYKHRERGKVMVNLLTNEDYLKAKAALDKIGVVYRDTAHKIPDMTKYRANMSNAIAGFGLASVLALIAIPIALLSMMEFEKMDWRPTSAIVTDNIIEDKSSNSEPDFTARYKYSYTVDGTTYFNEEWLGSKSAREEAETDLSSFPKGHQLIAFVNPKDPNRSSTTACNPVLPFQVLAVAIAVLLVPTSVGLYYQRRAMKQ